MSRLRRSSPVHDAICCSLSVATDLSWATTRWRDSLASIVNVVALMATAVSTTRLTK